MEYRIMEMDGGMITPRLGAVVMTAEGESVLVFLSTRAGIMKPPIATTVATVDPLMAPNRPQAMTPAMASPPGSQPTTTLANLDQFVHNGAAGHNVAAQHKKQHHHQGETYPWKIKGAGDHHGIGRVNSQMPTKPVKNKQRNTGTVDAMHPNSSAIMMR
jgi:hypothetical protein